MPSEPDVRQDIEPAPTAAVIFPRLEGHTALVTGAGRNIGRAIAMTLGGLGASVACGWHRDQEAALKTVGDIRSGQGQAVDVQVDLSCADGFTAVIEDVCQRLGPVDILIHNASIRPRRRIEDVTVDEWDLVHHSNLRGPFLLTQAALPGMRRRNWGRVLFIGGLDAYWGKAQRPHVVATKLGMVGLARALANETGRWGITINTVVPGTMDTKRPHPEWYPTLEEEYRQRMERIPMGRLGTPQDVANACAFLVSEAANYITGQELRVTGGAYPLVRQANDDY
jgi:3-oxoacyl-[acyl-carrier protein] reductase